jgi:transglutaminase superfamily protein
MAVGSTIYRSQQGSALPGGGCGIGPIWAARMAIRAMHRARKFLTLSAAEKRQLLHAGLLVLAFRLGLWCVPYRVLRRAAEVRCRQSQASAATPARIAKQVGQVARFIPVATCLTQALAATVLMRRAGMAPELRIGAARDEQGQFKAHAWVEYQGRIVIGDIPGLASFVRLQQVQPGAAA